MICIHKLDGFRVGDWAVIRGLASSEEMQGSFRDFANLARLSLHLATLCVCENERHRKTETREKEGVQRVKMMKFMNRRLQLGGGLRSLGPAPFRI